MKSASRRYAVLFGAAAFALYLLTLSPDVFWGDAAQLQTRAARPVFGAAPRSYPLYVAGAHLLFRLTPLSPAVAANLFSAVCGGVAVGLLWLLARRESGTILGGSVGAVALAVNHLHWSSSSSAEVYGLSALFLVALLLLVRPAADGRRPAVFGAGLLIGLSLLHHRILPLTAAFAAVPVLVVWIRHGRAWRGVGVAFLGFLAGALPFVALLATSARVPLASLFDGTSFRLPGSAPDLAGVPHLAVYVGMFLVWFFPGPQLLLAVPGLLIAVRRMTCLRGALLAMLLTGLGLPFLYPHVGDRSVFLLPASVALAILASTGTARLAADWFRPVRAGVLVAAVALVPIAVYALAPSLIEPGLGGRFRGAGREHLVVTLWPGRSDRTEPREFAERVFRELPPDSLLVCHWGEGQVIEYLRTVEGTRPDLEVRSAQAGETPPAVERALAAGRPAYLSAYPFLPLPARSSRRFPERHPVMRGLWRLTQP